VPTCALAPCARSAHRTRPSHAPQGEESSSDDDSDDGSGDERGGAGGAGRDEEEDKPKAASAVEGLIETANPNAPRKAAVKTSQVDMDAPQELSRRERCARAAGVGAALRA
jgi:hypothetical protein